MPKTIADMIFEAYRNYFNTRKKIEPPGKVIEEILLRTLPITLKDLSKASGATRQELSRVIHGDRSITPLIAKRLEKATGVSGMIWLSIQNEYDLAITEPQEAGFLLTPEIVQSMQNERIRHNKPSPYLEPSRYYANRS